MNYYFELLLPVRTGSPFSFCESLGNADIWLFRSFWDVETPRPIVPNFKHVGGLHCKPAKQLSEARLPLPVALMGDTWFGFELNVWPWV